MLISCWGPEICIRWRGASLLKKKIHSIINNELWRGSGPVPTQRNVSFSFRLHFFQYEFILPCICLSVRPHLRDECWHLRSSMTDVQLFTPRINSHVPYWKPPVLHVRMVIHERLMLSVHSYLLSMSTVVIKTQYIDSMKYAGEANVRRWTWTFFFI